MYYVIQVTSGKELRMLEIIKTRVDKACYGNIFVPTRVRIRKREGKSYKVVEGCFPGYIFVETNEPKILASKLKSLSGFARLVGFGEKEKIHFVPLKKSEEEMILGLISKDKDNFGQIGLSEVKLVNKKINVISGPLMGFEGFVKKVDLHKREVLVELSLNGIKNSIKLGFDIIEEVNEEGNE